MRRQMQTWTTSVSMIVLSTVLWVLILAMAVAIVLVMARSARGASAQGSGGGDPAAVTRENPTTAGQLVRKEKATPSAASKRDLPSKTVNHRPTKPAAGQVVWYLRPPVWYYAPWYYDRPIAVGRPVFLGPFIPRVINPYGQGYRPIYVFPRYPRYYGYFPVPVYTPGFVPYRGSAEGYMPPAASSQTEGRQP